MRQKYKKFLKAAYIDYSENYCSYGSGTFTRPTVTTPIIVITGTTAIIACATSGATIYYTLDGSTPTSSSTEYTGAITLTQSCTIKAIAVKSNMTNSEIASEDYVRIEYLTAWRLAGNSSVHTDPYLASWKVEGNSQMRLGNLTSWKIEGNSVVKNYDYDLNYSIPDGYTRCKYLEGHGTEWIQLTFWNFMATDEVEATISFTDITDTEKYAVANYAGANANLRFGFGMYRNTGVTPEANCFSVAFGDTNTGTTTFLLDPVVPIDTNVHTYTYKNRMFKFDDSSQCDVSTIAFEGMTYGLTLFYGPDTGTKCRIYSFRHKHSNGKEINLVPCLDDNNVPCFYDTIGNLTYDNWGTGTFGYEVDDRIYSCGDLGQDGYYHIKIRSRVNEYDVNEYDIPLTEPLRKVGSVADKIEFANGVATVTRNLGSTDLGTYTYTAISTHSHYLMRGASAPTNIKIPSNFNSEVGNILCPSYNAVSAGDTYGEIEGIAISSNGTILVYDSNYNQSDSATAFMTAMNGVELIYELATPTTETIQVPDIAVSPIGRYYSVNYTDYSSFTYTEDKEILLCGDLGQDGKYHVKISNGVSIYDIPLTEPLRKVDDVADTIEFPSTIDGKALVTRNVESLDDGTDIETLVPLATPTTELINVSPFPTSPTYTYTSANVAPYSAFEYNDNLEIWSCGEYNATDGKYHILVQSLGGSIADIALDEPLRKVNNVADTIEFPSDTEGKALVTRNLASVDMGTLTYSKRVGDADIRISSIPNKKRTRECVGLIEGAIQKPTTSGSKLTSDYLADKEWCWFGKGTTYNYAYIKIMQYKDYTRQEVASAMIGKELIYELATPTTELVDAPQIQEAESYSCVISQGGKAVEWSSFTTE